MKKVLSKIAVLAVLLNFSGFVHAGSLIAGKVVKIDTKNNSFTISVERAGLELKLLKVDPSEIEKLKLGEMVKIVYAETKDSLGNRQLTKNHTRMEGTLETIEHIAGYQKTETPVQKEKSEVVERAAPLPQEKEGNMITGEIVSIDNAKGEIVIKDSSNDSNVNFSINLKHPAIIGLNLAQGDMIEAKYSIQNTSDSSGKFIGQRKMILYNGVQKIDKEEKSQEPPVKEKIKRRK